MAWRPSTLGVLFICFGVFFTGLEAWGTYDFFWRDQGRQINYIVLAGCGIALSGAFLPAVVDTAWRNGWYAIGFMALVTIPLALAVIVYAGLQRTGTATDVAQQTRVDAEGNRKRAEKTEREAEADLVTDKKTAAAECASGWRDKCEKARQAQAATQKRLDDARAELRKAPTKQSDSAGSRVAALTFGYVTEDQIRTYQPLFVPFLITMLAALFLSVGMRMDFVTHKTEARKQRAWGVLGRWFGRGERKASPASTRPASAEAMPQPAPRSFPQSHQEPCNPAEPSNIVALRTGQAVARKPIDPNPVIAFLGECVPAAEGERAEVNAVYVAYRGWCKAKSAIALCHGDFCKALEVICKKAGLPIDVDGDVVYLESRRVVAS